MAPGDNFHLGTCGKFRAGGQRLTPHRCNRVSDPLIPSPIVLFSPGTPTCQVLGKTARACDWPLGRRSSSASDVIVDEAGEHPGLQFQYGVAAVTLTRLLTSC